VLLSNQPWSKKIKTLSIPTTKNKKNNKNLTSPTNDKWLK
jgi:hypothetical protein